MIKRWAEQEVQDALSDTPVVLIHGPRQAGKSTLALAVRDRSVITLDDPQPYALARQNPEEFLKTNPPPVTIDEVQRAPELFLPMKSLVDRNRVAGSFVLTGSANVLSLPRVADSLAGRMQIIDLLPLSQAEIEGTTFNFIERLFAKDFNPRGTAFLNENLEGRIVTGGFPEPVTRAAKRRRAWFDSYVRTVLERDVKDLSNIDALAQVPKILKLLGTRPGTMLNIASVSRDTGIAHTTLTRYLHLLEAIFILTLIPAWSSNTGMRLAKSPKAYLVDTGLLCHLANLAESDLDDRSVLGPILENFVALELRKLLPFAGFSAFLGHFRTVKQKEVDFVIDGQHKGLVAIEVKSSRSVSTDDLAGLRFLREVTGDRFLRGILLYCGNEAKAVGEDLWALPISALWTEF